MTWLDHAACKGKPTALFFPSTPNASAVMTATAEQYCARCPVRQPCRDAGRDEFGLWGGAIGGGETAFGAARRRYRLSLAGGERLERLVAEYGRTG